MKKKAPPLRAPDGRYIVVRGRLWRAANPGLSAETRQKLVAELMDARRAVRTALLEEDTTALAAARARMQAAKERLGERGPVWWSDGAPDLNHTLAKNSPYATWFEELERKR